jgi:hypothetical protein
MGAQSERICIVVTTINSGELLEDYCGQAEREGARNRLRIIVIPDRKSPQKLYQNCARLADKGFDVRCPTLDDQDNYLKQFGDFASLIPYNSDNRRNIGFLMALEWGCEVLLSIDDDNFCVGETYATSAVVCRDSITSRAAYSSSGWFNVCELLTIEPDYCVYPRGFPYHKRHKPSELTFREESATVRLNAGLWLQDPDLDAMTWLVTPVRVTSFNGESVLLGKGVWSPINTQNTALHRDLIVAYYFVRMGYPLLGGIRIDRYGDIFSGYLVQACMQHMGHRVRVGTPIADHRRNSHNYIRDLEGEIACILMLEDFMAWLPTVKLEGSSYSEAYSSLASAIDDQVGQFRGSIWTDATRGFFHEMTRCMRQWIKACRFFG